MALSGEADPFKRKIGLLKIIAGYFADHGQRPPVVVGGEAVEIYTKGAFVSHDVDILSSRQALIDCLEKELGFSRIHHNFFCPEPLFAVEWQGSALEEGREAEDHVRPVVINGIAIHLVGMEDLVIDRLNAAKFSRHAESWEQARGLLLGARINGLKFDGEYAGRRAQHDDLLDFYERLWRSVDECLAAVAGAAGQDDHGSAP
jgi:hypothetical protein